MELGPQRAPGARLLVVVSLVSAIFAGPTHARADGPIAADGAAVTTSNYMIDTTHGTVLGSSRATGLAGAYSAIAQGVEGGLTNPASVAARFPGSVNTWDYWLALGVTYPLSNGDYYNSGRFLDVSRAQVERSVFFLNPGAYFQLYRFGFGVAFDLQGVTVSGQASGSGPSTKLSLAYVTTHLQVGYRFFDGQLTIGGGLMILHEKASGGLLTFGPSLHGETGFGGEVGALVRPHHKQWRIGAALYSAVRTHSLRGSDSTSDVIVGGYYLPRSNVRPWQGSLAFAYQFGKRPLNPRFTYVEEAASATLLAIAQRAAATRQEHERMLAQIRERGGVNAPALERKELEDYEELRAMFAAESAAVRKATWRDLRALVRTGWPRRYVLLTAELTFTGRVRNAVGVESFLLQTVQRSGEHLTVTPRVGVESEVWPRRMKVRGGLYVEPSRFATNDARVHGTFGFDFRVLQWDVFRLWPEDYLWQVSIAMDVTRGYRAISFGFGGWY